MEWEEVLTVHVVIQDSVNLQNDLGDSVVMISFTGHATGEYFEGTVMSGGVDTQIIGAGGGRHSLSARYMLRGTDHAGQECDLYIENNGEIDPAVTDVLFRTTPRIITNSKALSFLNRALLVGEGLPSESGVEIRIYRAR
ncbi:DUF3237 family protein [Saccharibacillus alkalitolerans]|uniref:DUF3237 domain-containing protein n=1 Tax=Saccharibacillus alkalitolerans TaxID=2705290 RepID=A0ABX0F6D5_9BACL|nr:DUF3237 family protein [Saccharibacillus alkalitolerans]NGZ76521.1 DUF3237 domain-containing protein [Saccharibacillus alkalitolerans]